MPRNTVTMKDVAQRAGVSAKTVSNVINGNDDQASAQTRKRVRAAIKELGYVVNRSAQTLKKGRTDVIGLALPNFDQPFLGHYADTFTRIAADHGVDVAIGTYHHMRGGLEQFAADTALRLNTDGWVLLADGPLPANSPVFAQPYPTVLTGDFSAHGLIDSVSMPNEEATRAMADWLLERNRTVGFIGAPLPAPAIVPDTTYWTAIADHAIEGSATLRLKGYMDALRAHGRPIDEHIILPCERLTAPDGANAILRHLNGSGVMPDVWLCANDAIALGVMSELARKGIRVPEDAQITGFDDIPDASSAMPQLTTIGTNDDGYARLAVEALLQRIDESLGAGADADASGADDAGARRTDAAEPARELSAGFHIVVRGSTR